ncbi:MAG: hypothetical protein DWQ10_12600 [Calditrichaeota bacterium]|nr:MAG: hypothetical protein DWQ10_12600 [Calditrichota bacterium]
MAVMPVCAFCNAGIALERRWSVCLKLRAVVLLWDSGILLENAETGMTAIRHYFYNQHKCMNHYCERKIK